MSCWRFNQNLNKQSILELTNYLYQLEEGLAPGSAFLKI